MPLMTYEEYEKIEYTHPVPYKFVLDFNSNLLYFFGEDHSYDPNNTQWLNEKSFWQDFIEKTKGQKRIAFVEGGKPPVETSEQEAIIKSGGGGFITYIANKENIEIFCPEPSMAEERALLEKRFTKEQIQYYYFARLIPQWHRKQEPRPEFNKFINDYLNYHKRQSGWTDLDFSFESMKNIHKDIFKTEFNKNDVEFFKNITTPVETKTVVNQVSRMCSNIRDTYIVEKIQQYLKNNYSVYVQYGCTHAVRQEPLLRELFSIK